MLLKFGIDSKTFNMFLNAFWWNFELTARYIPGNWFRFLTLETKWQLGKQAFRSVKLVMCLLPRFNQNQLGEDIIKSEEPDLCCTKKCVI